MPSLLIILLLAVVQGAAELLPVSSSAHVILVEHWLGLDPTTPAMTLLLVLLHTGTMFAVIVYFWHAWRRRLFSGDRRQFWVPCFWLPQRPVSWVVPYSC